MGAALHAALPAELLKRTEEKREERKKERLDDYYRRNFGDYLSFQAGGGDAAGGSENQKAIKAWLQQNAEPPLGIPQRGREPQQE